MSCVSVITVNRNNARGLARTLESVGAQVGVEAQSIVVDGDSTDESFAIATGYQERAQHEVAVVSEADGGIYDAMNKGTQMAAGEFIIYLNSGDVFASPTACARGIREIRQAGSAWGFGRVLFASENGTPLRSYSFDPFRLWKLEFGLRTIPHQAAFFRKSFVQILDQYDLSIGIAADQEFMYRAALMSRPCVWSDTVSVFELGGVGSSRPPGALAKDFRAIREQSTGSLVKSGLIGGLLTNGVVIWQRFCHSVHLLRSRYDS